MGWLILGLCIAHGGDVATFELAAKHGAVEVNPAQQHGLMYGVHAASLGIEVYEVKKLARTGHKKRAAWMTVGAMAVEGSLVAWNLHVRNEQIAHGR